MPSARSQRFTLKFFEESKSTSPAFAVQSAPLAIVSKTDPSSDPFVLPLPPPALSFSFLVPSEGMTQLTRAPFGSYRVPASLVAIFESMDLRPASALLRGKALRKGSGLNMGASLVGVGTTSAGGGVAEAWDVVIWP